MLANTEVPGISMALRIVVETARLLGAGRLVPIVSAHADGCLYHGDSGVYFVERLVSLGAKVAVPTTCNVGALDLLHPELVQSGAHHRTMARRLMDAHVALGCRPSWTCAPYQAGHRPGFGEQVAWGESNAVAFVNSVLGARSNRYGDFLDICCAISGRAPYCGLHVAENRRAKVLVDSAELSARLKQSSAFYPLLGAWLGRELGDGIAVIDGMPDAIAEDDLKALGAGAAATGAVGLFHIAGVTPEAATVDAACQGEPPEQVIVLDAAMIRALRDTPGPAQGEKIDCVAVGSPHYSYAQCLRILELAGRAFSVPFYVCTHRLVFERLKQQDYADALEALGVVFVVDTCVVVTPILNGHEGVMMTDSAKFAHYGKGNTGYDTVFGAIEDCVASAIAGRIMRDDRLWH